ncbi:MAG: hypothetical protein BA872_09970 [Desulfobacterales bacterium C00003060]|nr:MAG: hypothetical protein BA861_07440 [Desulfobacterales bacterium S3730MH5]OEU78668.1 MAG: hypothetical protein BA865_11320 [Desulfobacterales bacterium S5133MH4]OEU81212.1 MAG: hypothetical protein BA872_09970 [Desulfobacterales bacterium C00003060]
MFNDKGYSKALVIGAGSGRDMASCVLITERLRKLGTGVDLAGFLTPWALHTFDGELEKPVNELGGKKTRKFIASEERVYLDSYFEPEMVKFNREFGLGTGRFYLFSLQYGTVRLQDELERLIKGNSYDTVIALDVGGDILARKKDYPWLLTPVVDFSCLNILAGLGSMIESHLIVVAPGVDGEIPCRNLQEIFDELEGKGLVLDSEELRKNGSSYQTYQRVNNEINSRTRSYSNTFRLIEKVVSSNRAHITDTLKKRVSVKERTWKLSFPVDLRSSLAKGMYLFDLKSIYSIRDAEFSYKNIFEAFMRLKQLGAGGTEIDLSFVPGSIDGGEYKDTVFLLTPPDRIEDTVRKAILEHGIRLTAQGDIQCSVILEKDRHGINLPSNLDVHEKPGCFDTAHFCTRRTLNTLRP